MAIIVFQKISNGELPRGGKAFVGVFGNNEPESNPVTVYSDFTLQNEIISSSGIALDSDGFPLIDGERVNLYIGEDFSFQIRDHVGAKFWKDARQVSISIGAIEINNVWSTTGVPPESDNMGSYTGGILTDDQPIKVNIQELSNTIENKSLTINTQTGTSYTVQGSDNGGSIVFTNAAAITLTVNTGLPDGMNFVITQAGAGLITWAGTADIRNVDNHTQTKGDNSNVGFLNRGSDIYSAFGETQL